MKYLENQIYTGTNNCKALYDLSIPEQTKTLIVFAHGYKGFKDWGTFAMWHNFFADINIAFARFNFTHNGFTTEPSDNYTDLEAFAKNRFSYELNDLEAFVTELQKQPELNNCKLIIMGHSRGGGIAQAYCAKNNEADKLVLFASVSDFDLRLPWDKTEWKNNGTVQIKNARTGETLEHNYSFYEDFVLYKGTFDLPVVSKKITCPTFIAQGDTDPAVAVWEAEVLKKNITNSQLKIYPGADHVFGAKHPYSEEKLPTLLETLLTDVANFVTD